MIMSVNRILFTFVILYKHPMKERLLEFLRQENKTSAQLAEEIGVQASGISHILSGRNNPSLDFVLKMLDRYKFLSVEWLLFGKGTMYRDSEMQSLFGSEETGSALISSSDQKVVNSYFSENKGESDNIVNSERLPVKESGNEQVVKIVYFYADNSFREYFPRN